MPGSFHLIWEFWNPFLVLFKDHFRYFFNLNPSNCDNSSIINSYYFYICFMYFSLLVKSSYGLFARKYLFINNFHKISIFGFLDLPHKAKSFDLSRKSQFQETISLKNPIDFTCKALHFCSERNFFTRARQRTKTI